MRSMRFNEYGKVGPSLAVQWLRLLASNARGQRTKIFNKFNKYLKKKKKKVHIKKNLLKKTRKNEFHLRSIF